MKQLFIVCTLLAHSLLQAQNNTDTTASVDVSDPTQNFTSLHFNVGIAASTEQDYGFEMRSWHGAFAGTFGLKKASFGFNIPFTNHGNSISALGDVGLNFDYQIHNNSGKYKASKIKFNLHFPTSREDNFSYINSFHLDQGFFNFEVGYVGSVQLTDHFAIYPEISFFYRNEIQSTSFLTVSYDTLPNGQVQQNLSSSTPKQLSQQGTNIGATFSYKWHSHSFIQLSAQYQLTQLYLEGDTIVAPDVTKPSVQNLKFGLMYQYGFNKKAHIYSRLDLYNFDLDKSFFYGSKNREYWLTFGFRYYLD